MSSSARGKSNINNSTSIGIGLSSSRGGNPNNSSRRGNNGNNDSNRPQLLDAYGRNLTPKPLIPAKNNDNESKTNDKSIPSKTVGVSHASEAGSVQSDYNENMSEGGFTEDSENENNEEEVQESAIDNDDGSKVNKIALEAFENMNRISRSDDDMEALITLTLRETHTNIFFALPALRVLQDTPQHKEVLALNERYDQMCTNIQKGGSELYPSRGVQTLNKSTKNKEIGTVSAGTRSSEAQVDNWDIYDSKRHMLEIEHQKNNPDNTFSTSTNVKRNPGLENVVDAVVSVSLATPGCLIDADAAVNILPPVAAPVKKSNKYDSTSNISHNTLNSSRAGGNNAQNNQQNTDSKTSDAPVARGWGVDSRSSVVSAMSFGGRMGTAGSDGVAGLGENDDTADNSKKTNDDDGVGPLDVVVQQQANRIFRSRSLFDNLALIERAIQQNLYHESHRKYRSGPAQDLLDTLLEAGLKGGHNGAAAILASQNTGNHDDHNTGRKGRQHKKGTTAGSSGHLIEGSAEEAEIEEEETTDTSKVAASTNNENTEEKKEESTQETKEEENTEETTENNENTEEKKEDTPVATTDTPTEEVVATHSKGPGLGANLLRLWTYKCPEVAGLNVTGMAWNNANRDLLAVSYGPYDFSQAYTGRGYIALWNLSNPEFPQALLTTPEGTGVTSIDFSRAHPSLLAAGMYNGCVCVYDVAKILTGKADTSPALVSDRLQVGSHTEAVWQVKWVSPPDEQPGTEVIVSVSTDGRVTEWSIKKGLSPSLLMILKRARAAPDPNKATLQNSEKSMNETKSKTTNNNTTGSEALGATGSEGLLSRTASGLAFDFPATDTSQYLVGTEDGLLARCSISYSEQYLDVTQAHSGPINRVRLSPFLSHACLTASSDWSVRLWSVNIGGSSGTSSSMSLRPITYSTDEVHDAVTDVAWSPSVSTRFASVTRDGHVQVWDAIQLQPLLDTIVNIDNEEWEAIQAKEAAIREALIAKLVDEERNRRKIASGGELDDEEDSIERVTTFIKRKLAQEEGREIIEEEEEDDDSKSVDSADAKPKKPVQQHHTHTKSSRGPPRKKFSTVLFADNTHVLLTGDSSGNVDVYRIVGLGSTSGHDEDLLSGSGGSTSIPMVGSEEFQHQIDALHNVLQSI